MKNWCRYLQDQNTAVNFLVNISEKEIKHKTLHPIKKTSFGPYNNSVFLIEPHSHVINPNFEVLLNFSNFFFSLDPDTNMLLLLGNEMFTQQYKFPHHLFFELGEFFSFNYLH